MALKVTKPGSVNNNAVKLSKAGKIIIILAALAVISLIAIIASVSNAKSKKNTLENNLINEINRASNICASAMTTLNNKEGETEIKEYTSEIAKAKKIDDKLRLAQEMLNHALKAAADNQSLTDELNGARNRIFIAQKEYNAK